MSSPPHSTYSSCRGDEIGGDLLSALPDSILHEILCLLSAKLAVQTGVLSRRWRNLWKSATDLFFTDLDFASVGDDTGEALSDFVESVLLLRDRSIDIRRFTLHCVNYVDYEQVSHWIHLAASGNLLSLDFALAGEFDLPRTAFACTSLRELVIQMPCWEIKIPDTIRLSNLRSLRLQDIDFLHDANEGRLADLISSLPSLVDLSLRHCYLKTLSIHASKLQRLEFHYHDYNDVSIRLSTPRLRFLDYMCDAIILNISTGDLPCLEEVAFNLGGYTWSGTKEVSDILKGLSHAKVMTLTNFAISLPYTSQNFKGSLPVFHNLRRLKLINLIQRDIYLSVIFLLQYTPNLETLSIEEPKMSPNTDPGCWKEYPLPPDYLCRLKEVTKCSVNRFDILCSVVNFFFTNTTSSQTQNMG